jgi:large subunit ribosomal protein L25
LPTAIPEKISVDVSALKIGDNIHFKDLKLPESVTSKHDPEALVFSVFAPLKVEETPVEGEGASGSEPEVIKKEKKVAEEGEEEAKGASK